MELCGAIRVCETAFVDGLLILFEQLVAHAILDIVVDDEVQFLVGEAVVSCD